MMRRVTVLFVVWFVALGSIARASEPGDGDQMAFPLAPAIATNGAGPLARAAAAEVHRMARATVPFRTPSLFAVQSSQQRSWISRHPIMFGTLVGAGVGLVGGVVGYATLDDAERSSSTAGVGIFLYPTMGAVAGALAGVVVAIVR